MAQLALVLTTVIWAATFPATKLALEQVLPLSFLFLRFLVSTLALVSVLIVAGRSIRRTAETLWMAAIASVFLFLGYVTQTVGMRYTTASNSAFLTALYVVLVPLFLRRFDRRLWPALALAVPAQRVALIFALEPALAAWLAWMVLGERLDAIRWVGSGLITVGVLIGTMPGRRVDASVSPTV